MESAFDRRTYCRMLEDVLTCGTPVYSWHYLPDGHLGATNCPDLVLDVIFEHTGCKKALLDWSAENTMPLILGAETGLVWGAVFEHTEDKLESIHLLGPVYNTEGSLQGLDKALRAFQMPVEFASRLETLLGHLPVILPAQFFQYVVMLNYCVTGERLQRSDIHVQRGTLQPGAALGQAPVRDRHRTYSIEQELLRRVQDGDLDYQAAYDQAGNISGGVRIESGGAMTQEKISCVVFASLCTRAAIEGGLSPELAYSLGDYYIQSMLGCKKVSDLINVNHEMYEQFIRRVHQTRYNPRYSRPIQSCCDYIELHLDEDLRLPDLAAQLGYTESYLSRKFKQEVGVNLVEYIRFARIEKAKNLLTTTDLTIHEIAEKLKFCSSSYFARTFRRVTGLLPQDWREQYRNF